MSDFFTGTIVISMLTATMRITTPLLLAALGELVVERAGVLNLGLEGMMLLACFAAFIVTLVSGSQAAGLAAAVATGLVIAALFGFMTITLRTEQFVTGLAINLLASGLTLYAFRAYQIVSGKESPTITLLPNLPLPFLSSLPGLGEIFFQHNLLTYLAFGLTPLLWAFLYRTRYGLELRFAGENPATLDTRGLSVAWRRYLAVLFGGAMAGLAGAFISLGSSVRFVPEMTAGRGWLAIVIVIAGNWLPQRVLLAALVFAFMNAFQLQAQALGLNLPYQLLLALPYVVAVLAMMLGRANSRAPTALGIPYQRP
jgi:simple sugar transport system permease protein